MCVRSGGRENVQACSWVTLIKENRAAVGEGKENTAERKTKDYISSFVL